MFLFLSKTYLYLEKHISSSVTAFSFDKGTQSVRTFSGCGDTQLYFGLDCYLNSIAEILTFYQIRDWVSWNIIGIYWLQKCLFPLLGMRAQCIWIYAIHVAWCSLPLGVFSIMTLLVPKQLYVCNKLFVISNICLGILLACHPLWNRVNKKDDIIQFKTYDYIGIQCRSKYQTIDLASHVLVWWLRGMRPLHVLLPLNLNIRITMKSPWIG